MSFANLKKQSKLGSLTDKLVKEVEKMGSTSSGEDTRFWKPTMGKDNVGSAVIRFLPAPDGEDIPWVKMFAHGFQGSGGWYIENSLTTLGQKDPVTEYNRGLWNSGNDKDKETVRKQKRKLSYYSNIYVVKDPTNPENEGKVFLFKFGKKIFDKILNAMQPEFEDETPINPFDFWGGANFRLKIRKVEGYWNYDKSEFDSAGPLLDDDDAMEAIWKKEYSLSALIAPDQFKTYEELEKRLNYVLGVGKVAPKTSSADEEEEYESYMPKRSSEENVMEELEASYRKSKSAPPVPQSVKEELNRLSSSASDDEDEDDAMSYFKRLAEE
jgi:hypothetical protein